MYSLLRGVLFLAILVAANAGEAADYATLYSPGTLQNSYNTYARNLRGLWEEDLLSRLIGAERQAAANVRLELPLIGAHRHPFDYYASPLRRRVIVPILSVKFFDDICTAIAWMERRGCNKLAVSDYVGVIRYQDPSNLPGGRFPSPLETFGVPNNALQDPFVYDVSGKALKSGIYFLMAHELAHVMYRHRGYDRITANEAQEQEIQADAFALNLMRRIAVPPVGMSFFFLVFSRFELAPGDFGTLSQYEAYLRERATHPLTSNRLTAIADGIRRNVDSFVRGQRDPTLWRPRIFGMADDLQKIGQTLDDRAIRELQRYRSRTVTLAELAAACR